MKRMKRSKKIYWIIGIVVVVLAAGGFGLKTWLSRRSTTSQSIQTASVTIGTVSTTISGSGSVRSGQSADISWQTSGTVASVAVQIGQQVKTGDELASLDPTSLSSSIIQAQSDLIDAQTALDDLLKPKPLKIAQAEAALTTAQENLDNLLNPTALAIAQADTAVTDAQAVLDTLLHPTALAIAQANTAVTDAQAALDKLLTPDPLAISQAETALLTAQTAADNAQSAVDRLKYARGSQSAIDVARAAYVLAQSEVERMQKNYEATGGDPNKDPVKAQALSALDVAINKRDKAVANLNWLEADWSASDIADKTTALALAQAKVADAQKTLDTLKNPTAVDIALAQGKLSDAQAALDKLNNPTEVDIALAQARVKDAQKALDKLRNPTPVDLELAKQQVADAQDTLATLKNGATADQITVAKSRVTLAEANLTQAKLTAPFDGTVTNVQILPGDKVSNGKIAFHIDDLSRLYVDLQISEVDISQIQLGQEATVTFDAVSSREYNGIVSKIVMVGSVSQGVVNYTVTVQLTDGDASILSGMTAAVNVVIAKSENVMVVPNKALRSTGGQRTVTVLFQGQQIQVPVTVGLVGDAMTEITGTSLKEGDVVVLTGTTASTSNSGARLDFQGGFPGGDGGAIFIGP